MKPATAEELRKAMVDTMKRAGTDPELIYAFEKTGRIVSEANAHQLTREDLKEWDAAIEEYRSKHRSQ